MWPFSRKARRQLGIDIGTSSIKIVELESDGKHLNLVNYAIMDGLDFFGEMLANPNVPSTLKMSDEDIALALRQLIDSAKIKTNDAIMSIPVFSSFITVMEMPFINTKELENAVPFEARSYIPVPLSEVVLDWLIIPPRPQSPPKSPVVTPSAVQPASFSVQGSPPPENVSTDVTGVVKISSQKQDKITVLLIAVPKEVVSKYQRIATAAKLNLKALESESFSLARALVGNDLAATMLIDFGARSTNITIIERGFIYLSHSADFSGKEITKAIARSLNVAPNRAEELKKTIGVTAEGIEKGVAQSVSPLVDKLVAEVSRTSDLFFKKENKKIEKIILTGGSAFLPGLKEYLSHSLGLEVVSGNPFARLKVDPVLEPVLKQGLTSTLAVSVGLAAREL